MKSFEGSFRNLNFSPSTSILLKLFPSIYRYYMFFRKFKTSVLRTIVLLNKFKDGASLKTGIFAKVMTVG